MKSLSHAEIIARGRQRSPTWAEEEFDPWADAKEQVSRAFLEAMPFRSEPPWQEVLPRISCPVLLITGDPSLGSIVTAESAAEAQRLNPRVQVAHLPGAGHNIRREQYDAFLAAVRSFLAANYR
jgi:N-formylmaleamate deformylase